MKYPVHRRTVGSLAVSIAIHVALVFGLINIVWHYPIGQIMGIRQPEDTSPEHLQYIALPSVPTQNSGGGGAPSAGAAPAALRAPVSVPAAAPGAVPFDSGTSRAAGGMGTGRGVAGSGAATGVVPRMPDPRIPLSSEPMARIPRSVAQSVDSIVDLAIGIYNDSVAIAARQRKPGDWTVKGKNGETWGWDQGGIRLGKFTIPNALLALLPLNAGGGGSPIEARSVAYIRQDVVYSAQRSISEDEFRVAVKRIRERKERERREKQLAADGKALP